MGESRRRRVIRANPCGIPHRPAGMLKKEKKGKGKERGEKERKGEVFTLPV